MDWKNFRESIIIILNNPYLTIEDKCIVINYLVEDFYEKNFE